MICWRLLAGRFLHDERLFLPMIKFVGLLLCVFVLSGCLQDQSLERFSGPSADAIVLLAGNQKERGPLAASLLRDGYAEKIILTNDGNLGGWSSLYNRNLYQIEWAEESLVGLGVPRTQILKLPFYQSGTIYDAFAVREYLRKDRFKRLLIVSNDYHRGRALWSFNKVLAGSGVEVDFVGVPSAGFSRLKNQGREAVKIVYYYLRYSLFGALPAKVPPQPTFKGGIIISEFSPTVTG